MKKSTTRRALILSILSLIMCASMLVGTTYAWFTDTVASTGNKIQSGKLDVQLWMADANGNYADISDSTDPIFSTKSDKAQNVNSDTLWEPGKTQVAYLYLKNAGNLALKYTVGLDVTDVTKNLTDVMSYKIVPDAHHGDVKEWPGNGSKAVLGTQTVAGNVSLLPGDTHYFALAIHMDEAAGNEYQNAQITFDLKVLATQLTHEYDSFNNQYDAAATVETLDELKAEIAKGGNILLGADIEDTGMVFEQNGEPVVIDMAGHTFTFADAGVGSANTKTNAFQILRGNNVTLKNGTLKIDEASADKFAMLIQNYADLHLINMTLIGENLNFSSKGNSYTLSINSGNVVIENTTIIANSQGAGAVAFDVYDDPNYTSPNVTVKGDSVIVGKIETDWIGNGTLTFEGGTVAAANDAQLSTALGMGADVVLAEGEYTLPTNIENASLTADGDVTINVGSNTETVTLGDNVQLKGINFTNNTTNSTGLVKATGENIVIEGCTFELVGSSIGVGIGTDGTSVVVKNCTFTGGKKGICHTSGNDYDLTVDNCTFDDADAVYGIHVNAVKGDIIIKNSTIGLFNTFFGYEDESKNTGALKFENCSFICVPGKTNVVKLYRDAEFVNCTFEEGFLFSNNYANQDADWIFTGGSYGDGTIKDHFLADTFSCNVTATFDNEVWNWDKTTRTWTQQ